MTKLAINGGTPSKDIKNNPWPAWPVWGKEEEKSLIEVLNSGVWSYNGPKERDSLTPLLIASSNSRGRFSGSVTLTPLPLFWG